jgi:hypothetical protein
MPGWLWVATAAMGIISFSLEQLKSIAHDVHRIVRSLSIRHNIADSVRDLANSANRQRRGGERHDGRAYARYPRVTSIWTVRVCSSQRWVPASRRERERIPLRSSVSVPRRLRQESQVE